MRINTELNKTSVQHIFLVLGLLMVLFFTFQNPEQSRILSETVRGWLGNIGVEIEYKALRSNVHILEYFIVGLAVCCVFKKSWIGLIVGCGIGLFDESLKMLLPGREFSSGDVIRDFIGVGIAICLDLIIQRICD